MLQSALCVERGLEGICGCMKRRAKGVADDLKDVAVMRLNSLMQNRVMPREESRHLSGELLRQRSAALDVGEEKGDGAAGQVLP